MFTKKNLSEVLFRLIKERFGAFRSLAKNTTFAELQFDKFDIAYLVMACEEYFKIHITNEEVGTLLDVRSLFNLVTSKLRELGTLQDRRTSVATDEEEAAEAMADAEGNDGVPVGKTEGDFEREDLEEEQRQEEAQEQKQPMNTEAEEKVPAEPPAPVIAEDAKGE